MPTRLDSAIAVALLVLSQVEVWGFGVAGGGVAGAACIGAIAVASAWRTRFPLGSTAAMYGLGFVCSAVAGQPASITFAAASLLAFYRIGTLPQRRRALAALVAAFIVAVPMTDHLSLNKYLGITLFSFCVPWLVGTIRLRQQRLGQLERERERAVLEERARLARELHDLVSHNVGMMVVQAGAGDVLLDREPDRAREALRAIETGGREALLELRRLLGLLRDNGEAELAPQPGLGRLEELAERVRAAGIEVGLRIEVEPRELDAALDLSAYRIVQEALTNVLKHARARRVDVLVRRVADALELEVEDDGRGLAPGDDTPTSGHGLVGMAERVSLLGGQLDAGSGPGGGFRVHARLPVAASAVS
jgi:signal transduction histidine kinase